MAETVDATTVVFGIPVDGETPVNVEVSPSGARIGPMPWMSGEGIALNGDNVIARFAALKEALAHTERLYIAMTSASGLEI
jgi:hypothetical protein